MPKSDRHPEQPNWTTRRRRKPRHYAQQQPEQRPEKQPVLVPSITFTAIDSVNRTAVASVTPGSGGWVEFVEIYKEENGDLGEWVADMWYDRNQGEAEIWRASAEDFIFGEPQADQQYFAVCYVSSFNTASDITSATFNKAGS